MPKKGQYDLSDLDVSGVAPVQTKGKYTQEDLHPSQKIWPKEMTESGQLDPGSVANIANPAGALTGQNKTGVVRSGLNLVGALGAAVEESVGIDPNNQLGSLLGAVYNMGKGIVNSSTPKGAIDILEGTYHGIIDSPGEMRQGIRENNPDKFISGLGGTAAVTVPTVRGIMEIPGAMKSKPQPQFDPSKPRTELTKVPRAAEDYAKIHGGDSSYELKQKFENEVYETVKNDIKQSEKNLFNGPAKNTKEHFAILNDAAKRVWKEYKQYLNEGSTIDGNEVIKRADSGYVKAVKENHPAEYQTFKSKLEEAFKDQKLSPEEAQARLTQLNAEAEGYYASESVSDMAAKKKLVGAQKYLATGDALRSILDEHLPEGASGVRKRYGALADSMSGMPMPSEAGKGFIKALFDESAKAMSTRPGFAAMRGGLRAARLGGTDKLVRRMYAETPYGGDPTTTPTRELTHPVTGEKQTVTRGPNAVAPVEVPVVPNHPISPREVLQGNQPLELPQHPLDNTRVPTGLSNKPLQNAPQQYIQHPQYPDMYPSPVPPVVNANPAIAPALPNVNQRHSALPIEGHGLGRAETNTGLATPMDRITMRGQLPVENTTPLQVSTPGHPMTRLDVGQIYDKMPHETPVNPISQSQPQHPMTALPVNQNQPPLAQQPPVQPSEPIGRPAPLPPDGGYPVPSGLQQGSKPPRGGTPPSVSQYMGSDVPSGGSGDVRYQSVKPQQIPIDTMQMMNRGTFAEGLSSSGIPMMTPDPTTLKRIGGKLQIPTGLPKGK